MKLLFDLKKKTSTRNKSLVRLLVGKKMAGGEQSRTYTFSSRSNSVSNMRSIIFKSVEFILCLSCILLFDDPAQNYTIRPYVSQRIISLCYGTFVFAFIFSSVFLIAKFIGDEWPWKTTTILSGIASVLLLICSIFLIKDYANIKQRWDWLLVQSRDSTQVTMWLLLMSGILSLIAAITFLIEAILAFWFGRK